jgi:hypothetical protein
MIQGCFLEARQNERGQWQLNVASVLLTVVAVHQPRLGSPLCRASDQRVQSRRLGKAAARCRDSRIGLRTTFFLVQCLPPGRRCPRRMARSRRSVCQASEPRRADIKRHFGERAAGNTAILFMAVNGAALTRPVEGLLGELWQRAGPPPLHRRLFWLIPSQIAPIATLETTARQTYPADDLSAGAGKSLPRTLL